MKYIKLLYQTQGRKSTVFLKSGQCGPVFVYFVWKRREDFGKSPPCLAHLSPNMIIYNIKGNDRAGICA